MTALSARSLWLAHLRYCTRCPTSMCPVGEEIAAEVRESMAPGESWQGVYRPVEHIIGQLELPRDPET